MSDYYWSNTLEVIGSHTRVQRIFMDFYSFESVPCTGRGAALDLEKVLPIPEPLRQTRIDELVKDYHALYVMPPCDLPDAPWIYRSPIERARLEHQLASLDKARHEEIVQIAIERDCDAYQEFGALDEDDWCRRFWGCYENTFSRQGGVFEPDQRGVRLWCRFSTEIGWPKHVLEHLARTYDDLTFINEATDWTGQKVFMMGSAGYATYKTVAALQQEEC